METITLNLPVPDKLCMDLLTACVDGGSSYWLAAENVERDADMNATKIVGCFDAENQRTKWGDATVQTMREGIRRLLSGEVKVNMTTVANLMRVVVNPNDPRWDSADADCVLQAGLLGSITYG